MERLVSHLNAAENLGELIPLERHLRAVTDAALLREDERAANLCYQFSLYLFEIEDYPGARHYNERSLAIRIALLGENHPGIVANLHHMGWTLDSQTADARPYHERALTIRRATLGDDHPDTAESFNYVGTILHAQCDYAGARYHYEQALAIREHVLGECHNDTAQSHNNLGLLLHAQGYYIDALRHYERAQAIREQILPPNHPGC